MTEITVCFENELGPIKPMHGVGQPPMLGIDTQRFRYLSEAHIPFSRLHDVGGIFGGNLFVDIPNVFRDFNADENDPASYDFAFTDILIKGLIENGCEPIYRLGVTIENYQAVKPYRIYPPRDFEKWARICEHVIRHYNEGWANGFHYKIRYWEIWNEPDGHCDVEKNEMWKGTPEEYYHLYAVTSRHLKKCFGDSIMIGGYACCGFYAAIKEKAPSEAFGTAEQPLTDSERRENGFIDFFNGFIQTVQNEKLPLDFFSYHSYASVSDTVRMNDYAVKRLRDAGCGDAEIHLNEWNPNPRHEERGTALACANAVAMMCAMQYRRIDVMCYYDARIGTSVYGGLFHPMTYQPLCTYYGFKAFGQLYDMGTQTEILCPNENIYALAAKGNGKKGILLANVGEDTAVTLNLTGEETVYLIDDDHFMTKTEINPKSFTLRKNAVVYIEG